jgi:hypothetical protein
LAGVMGQDVAGLGFAPHPSLLTPHVPVGDTHVG